MYTRSLLCSSTASYLIHSNNITINRTGVLFTVVVESENWYTGESLAQKIPETDMNRNRIYLTRGALSRDQDFSVWPCRKLVQDWITVTSIAAHNPRSLMFCIGILLLITSFFLFSHPRAHSMSVEYIRSLFRCVTWVWPRKEQQTILMWPPHGGEWDGQSEERVCCDYTWGRPRHKGSPRRRRRIRPECNVDIS